MSALLGLRVRDRLTGFEGVAVARTEHLHGAPEIRVETLLDGKLHSEWFAEERLEAHEPAPAVVGFGTLEPPRLRVVGGAIGP
jgi:hypothetical protein